MLLRAAGKRTSFLILGEIGEWTKGMSEKCGQDSRPVIPDCDSDALIGEAITLPSYFNKI